VTGAEFSGVDIDLLTDYVCGALDGTPDESVVAALVADDPAWRGAHETLTGGMAAVGDQLRRLDAEPMPADVASRLDAALAALPPLSGPESPDLTAPDLTAPDLTAPDLAAPDLAAPDLAASGPGASGRVSGDRVADRASTETERRLHAVPDAGRAGAERERAAAPGRRRTLRRWAAPIAVAAGALVFAGVGLGELFSGDDSATDTASSTGLAEQNAPMADSGAPRAAAGAAEYSIANSGIDYRRDTLVVPRPTPGTGASADAQKRSSNEPDRDVLEGAGAPPALQRLAARAALLACLDAIAAEHGGGAIATELVDFARFEGKPALVVRFIASDGSWAWAGGPDCGTPGAGAATLYQVRVG
jgi:negative regulator of sigma E activity